MVTLEHLNRWLQIRTEGEKLEFKEAKQQYSEDKLFEYCVALANEGGGYFVLGVTDKFPRVVVGSQAFTANALNDIKRKILVKLKFRVEATEIQHPDGRVLVFEIPPRPSGVPRELDGTYFMRSGESLVPMTPDVLKRIFAEGEQDWFAQSARTNASPEEVIALLDTQIYFELLGNPYPTTREGVLERLENQKLIQKTSQGWTITNLAAILLAKQLEDFSLERKAPRVILYTGKNKLETREERTFNQGYAVSFVELLEFIHSVAPQNRFIEEVRREETKMFPKQALRELLANALIHQDFLTTGSFVTIELYVDRVEISNPGIPAIKVERFIDEYRSRNEALADTMRRFGICDEKGSGIDKVIHAAEIFQLPAPDFRVGETRTIATLFAHQNFLEMNKTDRIRACYQHCCLLYVSNQRMSNQTLRDRFGLDESKNALVSQVIGVTKDANLIKADETSTNSTRYARYLPYWA